MKLKEVTFLHSKGQEVDFESLGIRNREQDETTFMEYRSFIDPDSIHSLSEGYYEGTTDIHYGSWGTFLILKGSLDENILKLYS